MRLVLLLYYYYQQSSTVERLLGFDDKLPTSLVETITMLHPKFLINNRLLFFISIHIIQESFSCTRMYVKQ